MEKKINVSPSLLNKMQSKNSKGEFIAKLLHSTMQTHLYHLMSGNYAQHKALGSFYDEMPDLADSIAETLMGTEGKITGYPSSMTFDTSYNPVSFLNNLRSYIVSTRDSISNKTNFMNQTDAILDLIDSTLYKLKELK